MARRPIQGPRLLVCEGPSDAMFYEALLANRGLTNLFSVRSTIDGPESNRTGIDAFGTFFSWLPSDRAFYGLTDIVAAADADRDANANFEKVRKQMREAKADATPPAVFAPPAQMNVL